MNLTLDYRVLGSFWKFSESEKSLERIFHSCILIEPFIFIFGGIVSTGNGETTTNSFIKYDLESGEFTSLPINISPSRKVLTEGTLIVDNETDNKLPPLSHHTMNLVENRTRDKSFYVFGGQFKSQEVSNRLFKFNLSELTWEEIVAKGFQPDGVHSHTASVVDLLHPKLYFFGGNNGEEYSSILHIFDTEKEMWRKIVKIRNSPDPRAGHSVIGYGSELYIFGGGNDEKLFNDLWCFNVELEMWENVNTHGVVKPTQRTHHSGSAIGNKMITIGGVGRSYENDVMSLDLEERKWEVYKFINKDQKTPRGLYGHGSVKKGSKIWIVGGKCEDSTFGQLYTLETGISVSKPVEVTRSHLSEDFMKLVNDRRTGDIILDVNDIHFYCHKMIFRVRCPVLNKECIKNEHYDSINISDLVEKLKKRMKRRNVNNFFADKIGNDFLNENSFMYFLTFVYSDEVKNMESLSKKLMCEIGYLAKLFQLERLYLMALSSFPNVLAVAVLPTTLFSDMKKLFRLTIGFTKEQKEKRLQIESYESEISLRDVESPGTDNMDIAFSNYGTNSSTSINDSDASESDISISTGLSSGFTNYQSDQYCFCDASIKIEDDVLHVHKSILVSRSEKFKDLLTAPEFNGVLEIEDMRMPVLKILVEFLYTGKVDIGFDVSLECLIAAEEYDLERLSLLCQNVIEKRVHVHNVCRILNISELYNITYLKDSAILFIANHLNQVKRTNEFRKLSPDMKYHLKQKRKNLRELNQLYYQKKKKSEEMKFENSEYRLQYAGKNKYIKKRKSMKKKKKKRKFEKQKKHGIKRIKGKKKRMKRFRRQNSSNKLDLDFLQEAENEMKRALECL